MFSMFNVCMFSMFNVCEKHGKVKATEKYVKTLNLQNALWCKTAAG